MPNNKPSKTKLAPGGKRKPRGKPFEKGNKVGPRFKSGESGNPDGTSKLQCLSTELRRQLPELAPDLVRNLLRRARKNCHDLETVWARAEGPLPRDSEESGSDGMKVILINPAHRPPRPAASIPPWQEGD
jgi:hypothetical protein